jgi:uncharacterized protein HemY
MTLTIQRFLSWFKGKNRSPEGISATELPEHAISDDAGPDKLVSYDENLLERSRTQWQFGDWLNLSSLSREQLQHHPERAKLALLAAAGHQALGNVSETRQFVHLAMSWGCNKQIVSQILIAGVYNTLGRATAIAGDGQRALAYFQSAISTGTPGNDLRLLARARATEQLAQLELPLEMLRSEKLVHDFNSSSTPIA